MSTLTRTALAASLLVGATAAADASFRVRAVHASPDAGTVDVLANGGLFVPGFEFNTATPYVPLPNGNYDIDLTPAGQPSPVFDLFGPADLADVGDVTIVAANRVAELQPIVLFDDNTIDPNAARLRIVHASPDAGNVSILAGGAGVVPSLDFTGASSYLSLPGGTYDTLQVRLNDASGALVDLPTLELVNGFVYTVFATGLVDPTPGTNDQGFGVLFTTDAPAPGGAALALVGALAVSRRRR
ncbi:MAG: DUF4397 domain-containing protein [Planctomycetota bacterium]